MEKKKSEIKSKRWYGVWWETIQYTYENERAFLFFAVILGWFPALFFDQRLREEKKDGETTKK